MFICMIDIFAIFSCRT